jgi:hypothetical protein
LITNIGPLPDMDNPVGKYVEFPLMKGELFVAFLVPDVLYLIVHVDGRIQKFCSTSCSDRDNSLNKTKVYVDLHPSDPSSLANFCV